MLEREALRAAPHPRGAAPVTAPRARAPSRVHVPQYIPHTARARSRAQARTPARTAGAGGRRATCPRSCRRWSHCRWSHCASWPRSPRARARASRAPEPARPRARRGQWRRGEESQRWRNALGPRRGGLRPNLLEGYRQPRDRRKLRPAPPRLSPRRARAVAPPPPTVAPTRVPTVHSLPPCRGGEVGAHVL